MMQIGSPVLLGIGVVVLLAAWWARRWAGRHSLQDLGTDAAWAAVKGGGNLEALRSSGLGQKLGEVTTQGNKADMAKTAARIGAKAVAAQAVGTAGTIGILVGLALIAAGIFWR